jgi:hypothetical protein
VPHGDITTIPVYSPEDLDFIIVQLVHGEMLMYQIILLLSSVQFIGYRLPSASCASF